MRDQIIAERFQVEAKVASGGMGTVYRGRDLKTKLSVAIKVLQPDVVSAEQRFSREAAMLAQISHPRIVKYLAHGTTPEGRQYLVMEWVEGETLKHRLMQTGLDIVETVEMGRRLAEALDDVHQRRIIHRDIKPSNLAFPHGAVSEVKILDFGIARRSDDLIGPTRTGIVVGSPGYMAPEQVRGERATLDHRADLFAVGCVLYECLTGRPPFKGDPLTVRAKVLLSEPPPIRKSNEDVSCVLERLVQQLLEKDRQRRPENARAVAEQLAALHEAPGVRRPLITAASEGHETLLMTRRGDLYVDSAAESEASQLCFLLLAGMESGESGSNSEEKVEQWQSFSSLVTSYGGRLELLEGKWWLAVLSGSGPPNEEAIRAAGCAFRMRALLPNAPMALVMNEHRMNLDYLIELGVNAISGELMESIFAQPSEAPRLRIRIDQGTAKLLSERYTVIEGHGGVYLSGERIPDGSYS